MKYIPSKFKKLFKVEYLGNTWVYEGKKLLRAERLYTAQNYKTFLAAFQRHFPEYVYFCPFRSKEIISAPISSVEKVYIAKECLKHLKDLHKRDTLQQNAVDLVTLLSEEARININEFGIHGSLALNMYTSKSDIDLVVYGAQNFRKLEAALARLAEAQAIRHVAKNRLEAARRFKGKYKGKLFMYNAVRKPEETNFKYGLLKYTPIAPIDFQCTVKDDRETMFRPAIYKIDDYKPSNTASNLSKDKTPETVVSMIGCYRNIAHKGDKIGVMGTLEKVENLETGRISYQTVVGTGTNEEEHIWPL